MREIESVDRTDQLKTYIAGLIREVCSKVFYEEAEDKTPYPYIVYYLEHVKDGDKYNYDLELHIWDKSVKVAESLTDSLEKLLDNEYYMDENQSLTIDLNARNSVPDQDKSLKHRRLLFNLQYYWKG